MKLYRWFHLPKSWRYLQCSVLAVILAFFGLCTITPTLPSWCGFGRCGLFPGKAVWPLENNTEQSQKQTYCSRKQQEYSDCSEDDLKKVGKKAFYELSQKIHL